MVPSVRFELTTYRLPSHYGFRRPIRFGLHRHAVRGLDYPFTPVPEGPRVPPV